MIEILKQADTEVLLFFNSFHSGFFDSFMMQVTEKFVWVPFYVALAYMLIRYCGWKRGLIWLAAIGLTISMADQLCASVIRPYVARLRPSNLANPVSEYVHTVGNYRAHGYSFPSCHGANSFALATIICLIVRRKDVRILILTWATLHVYSRIYLGVHYPGDVICGALIGSVCATLVYYIFKAAMDYARIPSGSYLSATGRKAEISGGTVVLKRVVCSPASVPVAVFAITLIYFALTSV